MNELQPVLLVIQGRLKPGSELVYAQYLAGIQPLMAEFGVEVFAVGEGCDSRFATAVWQVNGMLRFPSLERAEAFLADPRYLECKTTYRDAAYEVLNLSFFTPRPPKTSLPQPREVAQQAFDHFKQGLATGAWNNFFAMLTDDFTFWFPIGKYHGLNAGKERAIEFFTYVSQTVYPRGLFAQLDRVTGSGSTVIFEFRDEGLLFGTEPYQNRVAVAFEVRGEQICAYREYFGSDGKSN